MKIDIIIRELIASIPDQHRTLTIILIVILLAVSIRNNTSQSVHNTFNISIISDGNSINIGK